MKSLSLIEQTIENFQKEYSEITIQYKAEVLDLGTLHTFFLTFTSEKKLQEFWPTVSNFIAIYFQSKLEDDFGKWNTYLFYSIGKEISRDLKYKIENDTFSSRKIVIDTPISYQEVINDHILNNDLIISSKKEEPTQEEIFEYNQIIWDVLKDKTVMKKKRTNEAEVAFKEIADNLKRAQNEI
jgi:hypothetical protein